MISVSDHGVRSHQRTFSGGRRIYIKREMTMLTVVTLAAMHVAADAPHHPGGWLWIPFVLLFWGALVAGAGYLLFRAMPARQPSGVERARDILAERLARSEISTEEYYDRLSSLS